MSRIKSIATSVLIMAPVGAIGWTLIQNNWWTGRYILYALSALGFYRLWVMVVRWLRADEPRREDKRKQRQEMRYIREDARSIDDDVYYDDFGREV